MNPDTDFVFNIEEFEEDELEFLAEAGATFSPSDYYFKVFSQPDSFCPLYATITPKKYYDDNGFQFDGHVTQSAGGLLAIHQAYGEEMEGMISPFDPSLTEAAMNADLRKRGFVHNPNL
jgi:hypothetical protein